MTDVDTVLPAPPPCTDWCQVPTSDRGWQTDPVESSKRCECTIHVGRSVSVTMERFAFVTDASGIGVEGPHIRVHCLDPIDPSRAASLADAVLAAVEMIRSACGEVAAA